METAESRGAAGSTRIASGDFVMLQTGKWAQKVWKVTIKQFLMNVSRENYVNT